VNRHEEILRQHVEQIMPDVDKKDEGGRSLLHWAAAGNCTNLVSELLSKGANPNTADSSGRTPLQKAFMGGDIIRPSSARELFEKLAVKTDHDLSDGNALGSPIGEESITDYLALDILRARPRRIDSEGDEKGRSRVGLRFPDADLRAGIL
jgi:ankyrin repeat protein